MIEEPRNVEDSRWTHVITKGIVIVVLIAVVIVGAMYWRSTDHKPAATNATASQGPMPVNVIVVAKRNVPWNLRYLGQTEPSQQVEIRSRVKGYLDARLFDEGQLIKKGAVLFQIDPRPFEVELAQTEASLASAQARFDLANTQLIRYEELQASGAATSNELQEWQKEKRVAEAEVNLNNARVAQAKLDLDYTSIKAPLDGVIGESLKDVGSYIDDGANSLMTILRQVDPIYVRFSVSEQDMLRWQRLAENKQLTVPTVAELKLEITLSDGRKFPHKGTINFIDVKVDPGTGTAVIRGTVPNPDRSLRPGQFVHASLTGVDRIDTIAIPQQAVIQTPAGAVVYVVDAEGEAASRPVTLGDWAGENWLIDGGLQVGDQVIVNQLQKLRPGTPVAPTVTEMAFGAPAPTTQPAAMTSATGDK